MLLQRSGIDMAIWQFRLDLIPRKAIFEKYDTLPVTLPKDLVEDFPWWVGILPPKGVETAIDSVLPRAKSWSESMCLWGDERSDTASICYNNDSKEEVEWIGFRLDIRNLSIGLLEKICEFAKEIDCLLVTGSYQVLQPDKSNIIEAIHNSSANSYLRDPFSTLQKLKWRGGSDVVRFPDPE